MRLFDNGFDNHLENTEKYNLHPKLNKIYKEFPDNISDMKNLIFYGPPGIGKYNQVLYSIKKYSNSSLKYEKKITIQHNKHEYMLKISDIHYEVDFGLLGCNAKILWNDIFQHIIDIIIAKTDKSGIIVCKNFEMIHTELLDIFYSYMQTTIYGHCNIIFCLLTSNISFIPDNIVNICKIIKIPRPSKHNYSKVSKKINNKNYKVNEITNIKQLTNNIVLDDTINTKVCKNITDFIVNVSKNGKIKYSVLRDYLYDILIYNLDVYECIWFILCDLVDREMINNKNLGKITHKTYNFLSLYNNNYRPIYHLELFVLSLIKYIHEF